MAIVKKKLEIPRDKYSGAKERFINKYLGKILDNYIEALDNGSKYESRRQSLEWGSTVNLESLSFVTLEV